MRRSTSRPTPCRDGRVRHAPNDFELFELEIERGAEGHKARVTQSPTRKTSAVTVDLSHFDLVNPFEPTDSGRQGRSSKRHARSVDSGPETLEQWGRALFKATFVGELKAVLQSSLHYARHRKKGLRISLHFDEAPELAVLPWEAMGDTTDKGRFSGQLDFLVTRSLNVDRTHGDLRTETFARPRMLGVLSNPTGEDELSGVAEWQRIEEIFEPHVRAGIFETHPVEPPTLNALAEEIDAHPCEILHVVAHGEPSNTERGGHLGFEDPEGYPDPIRAHQLVQALISRRLPKLVVLNACYGASSSHDDAFNGVAQILLRHGVMAVVAMRIAISDAAAYEFADVLYRELAKGRTIESAMTEARRALAVGKHRAEWATPVLFMTGKNLTILDSDLASRATAVRSSWRLSLTGSLLALVILFGFSFMGSSIAPQKKNAFLCPSPPGLEDVHFVQVEKDSLDLGERKVVVETSFCISTTEVSRRDWLAVMEYLENQDWPDDWPVSDITIEEAKLFTEKLSERETGAVYRLPTSAELELAARGGRGSAYVHGDDPAMLSRYANCRNFLERDGYDGPAPVGSFLPNDLGLYDALGNVAEWVIDVDPEGKGQFLKRGGSFDTQPKNCSLVYKEWISTKKESDTGFRIVRELATERIESTQ